MPWLGLFVRLVAVVRARRPASPASPVPGRGRSLVRRRRGRGPPTERLSGRGKTGPNSGSRTSRQYRAGHGCHNFCAGSPCQLGRRGCRWLRHRSLGAKLVARPCDLCGLVLRVDGGWRACPGRLRRGYRLCCPWPNHRRRTWRRRRPSTIARPRLRCFGDREALPGIHGSPGALQPKVIRCAA